MKIDLKKFLIIISVIILLLGIIVFGIYKYYFEASKNVRPLLAEIKADTTTNTTTNTITNNILPNKNSNIVSNAFATKEAVHGEIDFENNMAVTIRAIVVKAEENHLKVMGITEDNKANVGELYSVNLPEDIDTEFKQGQEILIYFNGYVATTFPGHISAGKVEIIKEKSDIEIPNEVLKVFLNRKDNVDINVSELTKKGVIYTIVDANTIPYNYPSNYKLMKKVKNPEYTGEGHYIGEATEFSTQGYTRNRT